MSDIWKDPEIKRALKSGRSPDDIAVLACPMCGHYGYYNEGSHFYCRHCRVEFYCSGEDEVPRGWRPCVQANEAITLADTITDVTDGYENETRPAA
jgi:hypothetical protein